MILSIALWAGLFSIPLALFFLIPRRTRHFAGLFLILAVATVVIAIFWPVTDHRVSVPTTHLDQAMPEWQFNERHSTRIHATPQRIFEAIHAVTADDILFFRTLIAIRRMGRPMPASIMNAPKGQSLLDIATRTSFRYLANDPPRELVVATIVIPPKAAIATMNFRVTPDRDGSLLWTETRVFATTDSARRQFAIYWRLIHPGSAIIRRMWLRAIKKRAEAGV
jgi:hypothetical protein